MIIRKKVNEDGQVTDLKDFANDEVLVIRTPRTISSERAEKVAKALEKPLAVVEDVRRFVVQHRDLTREQLSEFTARYGSPADKAKAYAKHLTPEEFRQRVNELNAYVEKRLETISQDLEKRYDDLEREVEQAIERVFGPGRKATENGAEPVREVDVKPLDEKADAADAGKASQTGK